MRQDFTRRGIDFKKQAAEPCRVNVRHGRLVALDLGADDALPTEFRLFVAGRNETRKGTFIFDDAAAAHVLEEAARGGVDFMIDRAHDSLNEQARIARADADDALGWFRLELRGGDLWAVDVRWTDEGEERLRSRKQRYISPAFLADKKGRIAQLVNAALCSRPATLNAPALVAATDTTGAELMKPTKKTISAAIEQFRAGKQEPLCDLIEASMAPDQAKAAVGILRTGDAEGALSLIEALVVAAVSGEEGSEAAAPSETPLENAPEEADPEAAPVEEALACGGKKTEKKEISALCQLTGAATDHEARAQYQASQLELATLRQERLDAENAERRVLVGELVRLEVDTPATAWEEDGEGETPVKRLRDEPIRDLRARVETLRDGRGEREPILPPKRPKAKLSRLELAALEGMTPAQQASFIALREQSVFHS